MIDQGTISRFYQNKNIQMGLFDASVTCLNGFKYQKSNCSKCQSEKKLFTFNPNSEHDWICLDCFKNGDFEFTHDTELGYVDNHLPSELSENDARNNVSRQSYDLMTKTPNYLVIQGENWKCHCNDFMIYKGTWEAPDFTAASRSGNGRDLFIQMTENNYNHLWDECELEENESENSWQDCLYHVFECRHCSKKLGYWEY